MAKTTVRKTGDVGNWKKPRWWFFWWQRVILDWLQRNGKVLTKFILGLLWRTAKQRRIILGSKRWIENCKRKAAQMTWWHNSSDAGAGWTLDQVSRQTWFTLRLYHDLSKLYSCTITPSGQTTLFPNTVHSNANIQTPHCGSNATHIDCIEWEIWD